MATPPPQPVPDRRRTFDEADDTFLASLSHELRTPLAAILGLAVTLERHALDERETKELAGRIAANARKLDRIVTDLLDLDRVGRGVLAPVVEPVDVGALVARVADDSEAIAGREVSIATDAAVAEVDASKVERIAENLLSNAARHTPRDSRIWVRVRPQDDGVVIEVEDDGPGVPADEREAVFRPFHQLGDAELVPGIGIGLTLVARFAELHGGRAWVREREGGGASFGVWLPEHGPPTADRDAQAAASSEAGSLASQE